MQVEPPQCLECANFDLEASDDGLRCKAYPDASIPQAIIAGRHDHRKPYRGDHGVRYEERGKGT